MLYRTAIAAAAGLLLSAGAQAQQCFTIGAVSAEVGEKYGETILAGGMIDRANMPMVLFLNKNIGTWTLVAKKPDGCAVVVLSGTGWTPAAVELPGSDA